MNPTGSQSVSDENAYALSPPSYSGTGHFGECSTQTSREACAQFDRGLDWCLMPAEFGSIVGEERSPAVMVTTVCELFAWYGRKIL